MDGRFAAQPRPDRGGPRKTIGRLRIMDESNLSALRERIENGDADAVDELIELAGEQGNLDELRRLAEQGNSTAADVLIELGEHGNLDELRRLAEQGNSTAAEQLTELQE
jgi:hypothetical protein